MKVISILFVLMAMAMAVVVTAQPLSPVASLTASTLAMEPTWMVLSGAALMAMASAVRRYVP